MPYGVSYNKKTCHYMYNDPEGFKEQSNTSFPQC
jgi:hypothetical protein